MPSCMFRVGADDPRQVDNINVVNPEAKANVTICSFIAVRRLSITPVSRIFEKGVVLLKHGRRFTPSIFHGVVAAFRWILHRKAE